MFDLDQTLLDFNASEHKALGMVMEASGLEFSEENYRFFREYNRSLWLELEKGNITRTQLFEMRFDALFQRCGGASGLDPLEVNRDFVRAMSQNGVLMDGALEFVRRLKRDIVRSRIYIITNGVTINAMGRIRSTGLVKYIDGVFISQAMGLAKPSRAYFDHCLERIGEPRDSCIVIGDSLSSDMQGAKNAALTSVWFMPEGDIQGAMRAYDIDACASSFDELYAILRKWAADRGI